jgi:pimeloyl-ACP methyl ester carboxylesterase
LRHPVTRKALKFKGDAAVPMIEPPVHLFKSADDVELVWREIGEGRPVVLLHGYFSNAQTNWIKYGHAETLATEGFRVIMPDLRAHGDSAKPHDAAHYPKDVLANDGFALIAHLGLTDYDLGGYSLGGRTVARMLVRGATPSRAIISGMGLEGLINTQPRAAHFHAIFAGLGHHKQGSPEWLAEAFLKTTGGDPVALEQLLDTFVDTSEADLAALSLPLGVVCGVDDHDNGSAAALAELIPDATLIQVPGNHMSAVAKLDLGHAFRDFLVAN